MVQDEAFCDCIPCGYWGHYHKNKFCHVATSKCDAHNGNERDGCYTNSNRVCDCRTRQPAAQCDSFGSSSSCPEYCAWDGSQCSVACEDFVSAALCPRRCRWIARSRSCRAPLAQLMSGARRQQR